MSVYCHTIRMGPGACQDKARSLALLPCPCQVGRFYASVMLDSIRMKASIILIWNSPGKYFSHVFNKASVTWGWLHYFSLCAICSLQVGCHGFYPWLTTVCTWWGPNPFHGDWPQVWFRQDSARDLSHILMSWSWINVRIRALQHEGKAMYFGLVNVKIWPDPCQDKARYHNNESRSMSQWGQTLNSSLMSPSK